MRTFTKWPAVAAFAAMMLSAVLASTADVKQTKTVGAYRVELDILPTEPFSANRTWLTST